MTGRTSPTVAGSGGLASRPLPPGTTALEDVARDPSPRPGLFAKLLIPGLLISMGAGQVIPFLNLYVQHKFGLDLTGSMRCSP